MIVYRSFICNRQKVETIQISSKGRIVRQTVLNRYHGIDIILNNTKKHTTDTCDNLYEYPENYAEWKK